MSKRPDLLGSAMEQRHLRPQDGGELSWGKVPKEEITSLSKDRPKTLRISCHHATDLSLSLN